MYALTLIEDIDNMGVWNTFAGNALALHTMNPDGFTATYALGGLH
jgi:predicted cupin superfamily sugar epimerase